MNDTKPKPRKHRNEDGDTHYTYRGAFVQYNHRHRCWEWWGFGSGRTATYGTLDHACERIDGMIEAVRMQLEAEATNAKGIDR